LIRCASIHCDFKKWDIEFSLVDVDAYSGCHYKIYTNRLHNCKGVYLGQENRKTQDLN